MSLSLCEKNDNNKSFSKLKELQLDTFFKNLKNENVNYFFSFARVH